MIANEDTTIFHCFLITKNIKKYIKIVFRDITKPRNIPARNILFDLKKSYLVLFLFQYLL